MYIIEQGKAYQINGNVAYQVLFDCNGSMKIDKEKEIEIEGKERYSFDEVYKKLNIDYLIEQYSTKKEEEEKYKKYTSQIEELKKEIEKLTKENKELKAKKGKK